MSRRDHAAGCVFCGHTPDHARADVLRLRAITGDEGAGVESVNSAMDAGPRLWRGRFVVGSTGVATRVFPTEAEAAAAALELVRAALAGPVMRRGVGA